MRDISNEIAIALNAGYRILWISTSEEDYAVEQIKDFVRENMKNSEIYGWSSADLLRKIPVKVGERTDENDVTINRVAGFMEYMYQSFGNRDDEDKRDNQVFIFKEFGEILKNEPTLEKIGLKRYLKDIIYRQKTNCSNYIFLVSKDPNVPIDLLEFVKSINIDLPGKAEIKEYVENAASNVNDMISKGIPGFEDKEEITEEKIDKIVGNLVGFTIREIKNAIFESVSRFHTIDEDFIMKRKYSKIKSTGILNFKIPTVTMDDIGGNEAIKTWLDKRSKVFLGDNRAKKFGIPAPKGYVAVGVPGCAKSLMAEALAGTMNVPFFSIDVSKIFASLVGESEQKITYALEIVKKAAPCVLLFDEVEKIFGGVASSNESDSGVTARVFAQILNFLNDNDKVFVVMTSNDIDKLPPEFTRQGRLDNRWYFGLPSKKERMDILNIHFKSYGSIQENDIIESVAEATEGFTGAELKAVVDNCMINAFDHAGENDESLTPSIEDIEAALESIVPISVSSAEQIKDLEEWGRTNAKPASGNASSVKIGGKKSAKVEDDVYDFNL